MDTRYPIMGSTNCIGYLENATLKIDKCQYFCGVIFGSLTYLICFWGRTYNNHLCSDICYRLWVKETLVRVELDLHFYSLSDCITLGAMKVVLSWADYLEKVAHIEFYFSHIYREGNVVIDSIVFSALSILYRDSVIECSIIC